MIVASLVAMWMATSLLFLLPECSGPGLNQRTPQAQPGPSLLSTAATRQSDPDLSLGNSKQPEVPGPIGVAGAAAAWGWARRLRRRVRR